MYDENEEVDSFAGCANKCSNTQGCTHFVLASNLCYKYSGIVTKNDAIDSSNLLCGILENQSKFGKNTQILSYYYMK